MLETSPFSRLVYIFNLNNLVSSSRCYVVRSMQTLHFLDSWQIILLNYFQHKLV